MIYFSVVFIRHIPAKNIITTFGEKSTGPMKPVLRVEIMILRKVF